MSNQLSISNRSLAILLVGVITVFLLATFISLNQVKDLNLVITGNAVNTTTGTAQFTIAQVTELTNQVPTIDWGTGFVNGMANNCTLDSNGTFGTGCESFNNVTAGFLLENTGNLNLSVNYTADKNASSFIGEGSPAPLFQYRIKPNNEEQQAGENSTLDTTPSCNNNWTTNTYVNVTPVGGFICGNNTFHPMNFAADEDAAVFDLLVRIPENAPQGAKTATLTFYGTSSA